MSNEKQEQGEPVANYCRECLTYNGHQEGCSHYTTQPAQKPLTDEQMLVLLTKIDEHAVRLPRGLREFARAIEAAHGIKEKNNAN